MVGIFAGNVWTEPILHVDMDSFFVEVERLDRPDLKGRPVAVGGTAARGVIASASYEARRYGVTSAQPTAVARRLCPQLEVVAPSHAKYGEVSERVFAVFRDFTPLVEGLSLDEAFLDVSGLKRHAASPVAVAEAIRTEIREREGLPASVGVAPTKFVAKLASKAAKPDGLCHVPAEEQIRFLHALDVEELWGVGPATLAGLQRIGVETVGDLAAIPLSTLTASLGPSHGRHLHDLANGIDPRRVEPDIGAKSVSVEETYSQDLAGRSLVESAVMAHSQRLAGRLRRSGLTPRTISLKVRYDDFTTVTRSRTLARGTTSAREIFRVAQELLSAVPDDRPVRLLGVAGSGFDGTEPLQDELFDEDDSWDRLSRVIGDVEEKFGSGAVAPARLVDWRDAREPSGDD